MSREDGQEKPGDGRVSPDLPGDRLGVAVQDQFAVALSHHRAGRPDEAATLYQAILRDQPAHAGAWHLLGVVHHQRQKLEEAVRCIRRAILLVGPASPADAAATALAALPQIAAVAAANANTPANAAGIVANWTIVASYSANGNEIVELAQPDPDGTGPEVAPVAELTLDAWNNVIHAAWPDGTTESWTFDETTHLLRTSHTDPLGQQTLYTYDAGTDQPASVQIVVGEPDTTANGQTDDVVTSYTYTQPSADPDDPPSGRALECGGLTPLCRALQGFRWSVRSP